ncbi:large subunit ribosomal protein L19 [Marchantia polymorpha subsp. ruderalis]|uniref:Plastid ribosomal protein L19 n=3 Tax=Marchantia polymorpha TaxID=3197 RepID=A0AAF6AWT1_MARPO|nr:hypothetical protein MARPO_0007s0262 [Marchantia polymorpha]BBN04215.1 hypothetical protein Mp_3g02740 [Marchantia polymorpha subsp. ruderalis]|eukprot:PTQ47902.1 hypothetical protein MARPO_0007s0262 [Marchantia polymorpha]
MQRLRIMAATCLQQIACSSLSSSRALAVVPGKVEGLRSLSTSSSVLVKPWWRQSGGLPLRTVTARPAFIATRGRFNVQAQAVSTTSETEAEAAPEATTDVTAIEAVNGDYAPSQLKTKKLTKQVKHIMNLLNAEALEAASKDKVIPVLRPGDVVQLRVEVPENKRRVSLLRGIVIAIHNAGINSTFRIRRVLAGVGVEMIFPLYSPNIKEMKVVDKRRARRAKLYYLRDKIARLSSC